MAAVRVACGVGVVLEQIDVATNALVGETLLGIDEQIFQNTLAGTVMGDQLHQTVAFGGGVFRVAAHVEVEPGAVAQKDVGAATPGHHAAEQVPSDLVGAQPPVAVKSARNAELGLDPHNSTLHAIEPTG
ncbi:Uncharacterised protein [Mycobacteroides abscessus subsp. abscessus]|nr:Uncharacterised protein [Mycobacteroides abscessus subsp. abscessus]